MKITKIPKLLEQRPYLQELMDQKGLSLQELSAVEITLNRINYLSGNFYRTANWLKVQYKKLNHKLSEEFSFADIGCGGGGLLRYLHNFAKINNLNIKFYGIDLNKTLISIAESYNNESQINYSSERLEEVERNYSLINTNLVLHHLDPTEILPFLHLTKRKAVLAVRHEDLLRTKKGLLLANLFPKVITRSKVVHHDARVSVYRSYNHQEWERQAIESSYQVSKVFPERILLESIL